MKPRNPFRRGARLALVSCTLVTSMQAQESTIANKTLVAWVSPANLTQRGGSVLSLEKSGGVFDALVLGEIAPGKWMAGSEMFHRTQQDQSAVPLEETPPGELVQVAAVYRGRAVSLFRNGRLLTHYEVSEPVWFGKDSVVWMGLRHAEASPPDRYFVGSIEDARIYDTALDEAQLRGLKPNDAAGPRPFAWWSFERGSAADASQHFRSTTLLGGARLADGRLWLDKPGDVLQASPTEPRLGREPGDATARALRENLLKDPHRPGYHFVIPEGRAMPFDPNGAIFWKGRYHLFYIFQDHRGHNWGHVSSADLFHWRHHPTGLVDGMFSGNCFINADGRPTMCYHQVGQGNAMAVALDDDLNEWKKLDSNPITPETRPGDPHHDIYRSWDPFGWVEGNTYYAIFGGERPGVAKSPSLAGSWSYVGDLVANAVEGVSLNEDVSCADFFRLGNRYMLLCISHRLGCRYYLGDWRNEQFHPEFHEQMSWVDNSFFAPESLLDDRGRRIMWAWIFDHPDFKMRTDHGWSGTMSLPRVLWLGPDGRLRMDVPEEIQALRGAEQTRAGIRVPRGGFVPLEGVSGNSLEIKAAFAPVSSGRVGLKVCASSDNTEYTLIYYDAGEKKLKIDTRNSSLDSGPKSIEAGPLDLAPNEPLELRLFIDKSVVEVFANQKQAVMRRIYPTRADSTGVSLFAEGADTEVSSLSAWQLAPSNPF